MERLWSPWREKYIENINNKNKVCIFCTVFKENRDKKNLILLRGKFSYIIMNLYPYNSGHLLVVPNKHIPDLNSIEDEELFEMMKQTKMCVKILENVLSPAGFNIGINQGKVAGAGVEGHIHIHIVPRWNGDTNFMPVIGETKVISQNLLSGYNKLKKQFDQFSNKI
ncbi:HIT family hydrolase [candidate division KSB1 bacterium]|nr:MAG: HIT family hydrolase [candidate division KSB1 bacterium]